MKKNISDMDLEYDDFITDELIDQCEQVRSIAKKSWLSSASVSLAHLDNVKAKVYNVGLIDPKDLKATNLWTKKKGPDIPLEVPLSSNSNRNFTAWGSNTSIPEAVQDHGETLPKPTRPASAKVSGKWTRPPSGKKNRPQSAKEPIQIPCSEVEVETKQGFGVKGAKYDPNGRPPKGLSYTTAVGWVGPPAGLKYPDKPTHGNSWKIDFPMGEEEEFKEEVEPNQEEAAELPLPPHTTPIPPTPEPEEKTKRIFELYIGDPYKAEDDFIQSDSEEEEFGPSFTASKITSSTHPNKQPMKVKDCPQDSLRLDLPQMEDDYDEIDEVDTERLLAEAESVTQKLDLKSVISANKHIPESTSGHVPNVCDKSTNQNIEDKHIPQSIAGHATQICDKNIKNINETSTNKIKARNLVSQIIDENDLVFDKGLNEKDKKESYKRPSSEHEKTSVKFNEDVKTVSITPRNIGRKVEDMHHGKRRQIPAQADGFVDLIEVKNRIEPVLSTSKAELSKHPLRSPPSLRDLHQVNSLPGSRSRPPSGSKPTSGKSRSSVRQNINDKSNQGPHALNTSELNNSARPRSAPLNRAPKPITTVTVDYGESEEKQEKVEKVKKKKKRAFDDVETVIGAMSRTNTMANKAIGELLGDDRLSDKNRKTIKSNIDETITDKLEHNDDSNVIPTVVKSEPEKNYYEISRHSSLSNYSLNEEKCSESANLSNNDSNTGVPVIKTTKTLEFDEVKPKEVTIKSVIDPQAFSNREKELFLQTLQPKSEGRPKSRQPPSSAKPPAAKSQSEDQDRPGSRLGFVPMAPKDRQKNEHIIKKLTRPSSAPVQRSKKITSSKDCNVNKENINAAEKEPKKQENEERERVIDNLLERTKTLLEDCDKKLQSEETVNDVISKKPVRPASAHVGLIARPKDNRRVKSAVTKRPVSSTTARHRHYASYSHGSNIVRTRKLSGKSKPKVVLTEPCIITSNTTYFTEETEEDLACQDLQKNLADKGLNITAETLQRALYPPSGKSKHYQITADLPKRTSLSLLSHPKVWLPQEYKRLQQAEKSLSRANEIMYLQKKAEERRSKLESMGPEERKKLKKKGKKGGKKLRKSQSLG